MSHFNDDWFDDYIIMQMMEEDETRESDYVSANDSGCIPVIIGILTFILLVGFFF